MMNDQDGHLSEFYQKILLPFLIMGNVIIEDWRQTIDDIYNIVN